MDDLTRLLGVEGIGWAAGLATAAKAAGLLAGAGLAALAFRRRAAATRHLVWCLGLAGAIALPLLSLTLPGWGLPVLPAPEPTARAGGSPRAGVEPDRADGFATTPPIVGEVVRRGRPAATTIPVPSAPSATALSRPRTAGVLPSAATGLLAAWAVGAAAVFGWAMLGWAGARRLGRRAEAIADPSWLALACEAAGRLGLASPVSLLRGAPAAMPMTWGVLRPVVLLPAEADAWPPERRRAVLMHELAHVRRRDCLTQWLGLTACAAYWFNPLAWWAASRLRSERERACDDLVLEAGERPSDYAAQLLGVARSLRPAPALAPAALAMARPSGLERRLLAILDPRRRRRGPARWLAPAGLAAVLALAAPLAALRLEARAVPPAPARPTATADGDKSAEVAGSVTDLGGKPVPGAIVALVWHDDSGKVVLLGRVAADDGGRFRLAPTRPWKRDEATLAAAAPGLGIALAKDDGPELSVRLEPERPATVRIVDLQGAPVAGAEVEMQQFWSDQTRQGLAADWLALVDPPGLPRSWITDSDGRLRVTGLGAKHHATLGVRAKGFGRQKHEVALDDPKGAAVVLSPAHKVEGRITLGRGARRRRVPASASRASRKRAVTGAGWARPR